MAMSAVQKDLCPFDLYNQALYSFRIHAEEVVQIELVTGCSQCCHSDPSDDDFHVKYRNIGTGTSPPVSTISIASFTRPSRYAEARAVYQLLALASAS